MLRRLSAEAFGTFWLVFGGCGSAVLAAGFPELGIGFAGVALAFGLTVLTMAYAVGPISGGHFNPAVSLGLAVGGRFPWGELIPYWVAQVVGGFVAAVVLYLIASGKADWVPGGYGLGAAFLIELVLTAGFVLVILGSTAPAAAPGFAGISIGLALTLIHLVSIPVTNTSVNPARSTAVAFFSQNPGTVGQLWLFWLAPLAGAALGALIWNGLLARED